MSLLRALDVAVVGEGVVGCSTALALLEQHGNAKVTVFSDRPFDQTCSYGPAGLFRISHIKNREYGKLSFERFATIFKDYSGEESGVKLLSGHIQSDNFERLKSQEDAYGDIVFNFRWLDEREKKALFEKPAKHCIHYSAFASEGNRYVPFLKRLLLEKGVRFEQRKLSSLEELGRTFDVVFNCTGLDGGILAGDDNSVYSSRGVVIEVHAPWHKHFNYLDFSTFTIPKTDTVAIGTTRQEGSRSLGVSDADRQDVWSRYVDLHPTIKNAKTIREWVGLRPERPEIRVEAQWRTTPDSKRFLVIHNYGHGGNGFTLGWGTALRAVQLLEENVLKSKL